MKYFKRYKMLLQMLQLAIKRQMPVHLLLTQLISTWSNLIGFNTW